LIYKATQSQIESEVPGYSGSKIKE